MMCAGQSWSWILAGKVILLFFSKLVGKKSSYLFGSVVLQVLELGFVVNLSHEVYPPTEILFMGQGLQ